MSTRNVFNSHRPKARQENLAVQQLADEVLVFDQQSQKAHCLNSSVAGIWARCDGKTPISKLANGLGGTAEENTEVVWMALEALEEAELLSDPVPARALDGLSRRSLIKNFAYAAAALPLIATVLAPTPAGAASMVFCSQSECLACKNISATATCNVGCEACFGKCFIGEGGLGECVPTQSIGDMTCAQCDAACTAAPGGQACFFMGATAP